MRAEVQHKAVGATLRDTTMENDLDSYGSAMNSLEDPVLQSVHEDVGIGLNLHDMTTFNLKICVITVLVKTWALSEISPYTLYRALYSVLLLCNV